MGLALFKIKDGEIHLVIAESKERALSVLGDSGLNEDGDDNHTVEVVGDDAPIKVGIEDSGAVETRTASEWCALMGECLLASTAY